MLARPLFRTAFAQAASAHTAATSDGVRKRVADGMRSLADHWDDDEAMLTDTPKAPKGRGGGVTRYSSVWRVEQHLALVPRASGALR